MVDRFVRQPGIRFVRAARRTLASAIVLALVAAGPTLALTDLNVVVLYNEDQGPQGDGATIANYYKQLYRGVTLVGISGLGAGGTDQITAAHYLDVVRPQVLAALDEDTEVLVTTKGLPLRIDAGPVPGNFQFGASNWSRYSSFESELARVTTIDTIGEIGNQAWSLGANLPQFYPNHKGYNPYYGSDQPFAHQANESVRLTSRLDGFTVDDVLASLDRSRQVYVAGGLNGHNFILDDDPINQSNCNSLACPTGASVDQMEALRDDVLIPNGSTFVYDNTDGAITDAFWKTIAYFSFGTNDDPAEVPDDGLGIPTDAGLDPGYVQNQLALSYADGAIFYTRESFNAFSFEAGGNRAGQALVGDWLAAGGTAALGHVEEPGSSPYDVAKENILVQRLLDGATFVEAAWAATRQLSYVNTVVGDPLMTWTPWIEGDVNFDGVVDIDDFRDLANFFTTTSGATLENGDLDGDGDVDLDDFNLFASAIASAGSGAGEQLGALPEPGVAALLALGLPALLRRR